MTKKVKSETTAQNVDTNVLSDGAFQNVLVTLTEETKQGISKEEASRKRNDIYYVEHVLPQNICSHLSEGSIYTETMVADAKRAVIAGMPQAIQIWYRDNWDEVTDHTEDGIVKILEARAKTEDLIECSSANHTAINKRIYDVIFTQNKNSYINSLKIKLGLFKQDCAERKVDWRKEVVSDPVLANAEISKGNLLIDDASNMSKAPLTKADKLKQNYRIKSKIDDTLKVINQFIGAPSSDKDENAPDGLIWNGEFDAEAIQPKFLTTLTELRNQLIETDSVLQDEEYNNDAVVAAFGMYVKR